MKKQPKYSPEVIGRAVRMGGGAASDYSSQWAAIESVAGKTGCTLETLRRQVRQQDRDAGQRPVPTTAEKERINSSTRMFPAQADKPCRRCAVNEWAEDVQAVSCLVAHLDHAPGFERAVLHA
ncbi:hypothetical protein GCM10007386_06420 [Pseudoduganella dura]|nr:hypothetical protein GCM10007386_06420 [Pseudoduganella dura]